MIELLLQAFVWFGDILAVLLFLGIALIVGIFVNTEINTMFKQIRNERFANKLFNQIEEYRRDFA